MFEPDVLQSGDAWSKWSTGAKGNERDRVAEGEVREVCCLWGVRGVEGGVFFGWAFLGWGHGTEKVNSSDWLVMASIPFGTVAHQKGYP